jgi:MYXO-CTERM domain-containing protein
MRAVIILVGAVASLCADRAFADGIVRTFDLPHVVVPQAVPVEPFGGTFPGAIQWTTAPDPSCDPIVFEVRTEVESTPIDVEIVRTGPLLMAWRVPEVLVGTIIGARQTCSESASLVHAPVQVTQGQRIERAAPTLDALTVTGTDSLEVASGCNDSLGPPTINAVSRVTTTLFAAGVTIDDPVAALVDAWLVDIDAPLPAETDERAADAVQAVLDDDGRVLLRTELGGARDLAVRVIDRDTAEVSDVQRVSFTSDGEEIVGCTCSTSSSTGAPLFFAFLAFLALLRRRVTRHVTRHVHP